MVPVYKGKLDDTTYLSKYRPITLLPIVGKVIEKIMHKQLSGYLNHNGILFPSQYGFRKNQNTSFAPQWTLEKVAKSVDNGEFPFGVFIRAELIEF